MQTVLDVLDNDEQARDSLNFPLDQRGEGLVLARLHNNLLEPEYSARLSRLLSETPVAILVTRRQPRVNGIQMPGRPEARHAAVARRGNAELVLQGHRRRGGGRTTP